MYTINGKDYSIHDINVACAELMGIPVMLREGVLGCYLLCESEYGGLSRYNPCNNPSDTDAIIDKVWDELLFARSDCSIEWRYLMQKHNCTKLVAACICFIECNGGE